MWKKCKIEKMMVPDYLGTSILVKLTFFDILNRLLLAQNGILFQKQSEKCEEIAKKAMFDSLVFFKIFSKTHDN